MHPSSVRRHILIPTVTPSPNTSAISIGRCDVKFSSCGWSSFVRRCHRPLVFVYAHGMCVCGFRPIDFDETAHRRANPLSIDVQPQTEARRASTAEARTTTNRPEQEPGGLPFFVDRKKQKHWQTKHQTNKRPQPVHTHTHTRNYLLVFPLLFASGSKTDKKEGREGRSQVTRPNLKGLNKHSQTPAYTHTHTFD